MSHVRFAALAIVTVAATARGQGPPPTDIFLAPLSVQNGRVVVGTPTNVTNRRGYDNQPSFTPDGRSILYTSVRDDGQSDIYRYDIARRSITRVTSTLESEYSATVMPGGTRFSVIRVERDSTQRLWSFALDGSNARVVVESLKPVGYHAWIDATTLAMFVLGNPNALVLGDLRTGRLDTLARGVGRSLARLPNGLGFSFTQARDSTLEVREMRLASRVVSTLVSLPRGSQDLVWLADGSMLAATGSKLESWRPGTRGWADVADLSSAGMTQLSRLAISPDGKWLAIVAQDPR